jgi:methylmalonyl-CoA mutase N-terminal domain/subunit
LEFNGARSFNNVARTYCEAAAAALRNTILHTNALDKPLPTDFSQELQETQLYLQEETKITKTDPWLEVIM